MSRRAAGTLLAAGMAALLAGCAHLPNPFPAQPDEGDWGRVRFQWSRHGELYDRLDTRAFANAVYLSTQARRARAERISAWRALTPPEREAELASEEREGEAYDEFILTFFTPDRAENDLDENKSVWRIALVLPDGQVLPDKVEEVRADPMVQALYPFIGTFDTVYRIRFVRFPGRPPIENGPFTLRIAGPSGKFDLAWGPGGGQPGSNLTGGIYGAP